MFVDALIVTSKGAQPWEFGRSTGNPQIKVHRLVYKPALKKIYIEIYRLINNDDAKEEGTDSVF